MPPSESDWDTDKARFVADLRSPDHGAPLGPLAQQFATLTYSLLKADTVGEVLAQVVQAAVHVVGGADVVSVTLRDPDGTFHTPVETDPIAVVLDQLQYDFQEGPCLDAASQSGPAMALSRDLAADAAWSRFGPAAAERGVGSLLSTTLLPNVDPPQLSGALNIYSRRVHGLDKADQTAALLLATHATLALAQTSAVTNAELTVAHLHKALESRDVIGQAKGILMHRRGMTPDEAFDVLRRTSQDLNIKLVQLAETLVSRHSELDDDGQPRL